MRLLLILFLSMPVTTYGIELVIGGKTYYIKKYEIKDNGKIIVIPYTIHLSEEAFKASQTCASSERKPAGNNSSSIQESNSTPPKRKHPYNQLMNDLDGQYKSLTDGLRIKKKRHKRNFR